VILNILEKEALCIGHNISKYFKNILNAEKNKRLFETYCVNLTPEFQDSSVMKSIDAFVCTFPASMCQLWKDMGKSIVFVPAHRYNLGRCTPQDWKQLDGDLKSWVSF